MKASKVFLNLWLALALSGGLAHASSTRTIDADQLISSDHTKTYPLPTTADTLAGKTVPNGGTGAASFSSGALILGAGTSPLSTLVGTSSGQVATWNGSAWAAASASAGSWNQDIFFCNGTATSLTLTAPIVAAGSTYANLDGQVLVQGSSYDYTVSGSTVTLNTACAAGQRVLVIYAH